LLNGRIVEQSDVLFAVGSFFGLCLPCVTVRSGQRRFIVTMEVFGEVPKHQPRFAGLFWVILWVFLIVPYGSWCFTLYYVRVL